MQKTFKVGDVVTWSSQAGGKFRTKTGHVIEVLPPGLKPAKAKNVRFVSSGRDHESYLIKASNGTVSRYYWPKLSYLQPAAEGSVVEN